jgi:hypothetical protein
MELLRNLRQLGLRDVTTFDDIQRFHSNRETIIADARLLEEQRLRARISELLGAAKALEDDVERQATARRVELAGERDRLPVDLADLEVQPARTPIRAARRWIRKMTLRLRLRALTRHFEREVHRPYRRDVGQARRNRADAAQIERNLERSLDAAVRPLAEAKRYLETRGQRTFEGADGEEQVLAALSALPDEFTVFNDVTFAFPESRQWKDHSEWVQSAQVDHVVVGNDCVFLVETKNWSPATLRTAKFPPQHQVKRANHVVHSLAKKPFGSRKLNLRNLVVMIRDDAPRWEAFAPPYQYVWRVPPKRLVQFILTNHPRGPGGVTTAEACLWIQQWAK